MQVSITKLAELTNMSRDTIRKKCSSLLTEGRAVTIDSAVALPLLYGGTGQLDPQQEAAKLSRAKRELAELDYQQKRGQLITLETVFRFIDSATVACREHMMGLPGRWAEILAAETDPRVIERLMESEIRQALENIANGKQADFTG